MIRRLKTAKPEVERAEDDAKIRAIVDAALTDIASRGDVAYAKCRRSSTVIRPRLSD